MTGQKAVVAFALLAVVAAFVFRADNEDNKGAYKSLAAVVLDYFARPGDGGILREPLLDVRAAWRGPDLANATEQWRTVLPDHERVQLAMAVKSAASELQSQGRSLSSVNTQDIKFTPTLLSLLENRIPTELSGGVDGLGVHLIRGIPVDEWTSEEQEFFVLALSRQFGIVGKQDVDGQLIQHVRDNSVPGESEGKRSYTTSDEIRAHADPSDVVGLLCLDKAREGGLSRIVSSVSVYNEFLRRHPDMVDRLYQTFPLDLKGNKRGPTYLPIAPVRYSPGKQQQLRTFYTMDHFATAYRHPDAPDGGTIPEGDARVIEAYNDILSDPELYLDMQFEKGDLQFLSNHVVLHARTAFQDGSGKKRDLQRVWVSLIDSESTPFRQAVSKKADLARIVGRIVWGIVRKSLWHASV